jgi:pyruvate/2-oxoglutarate dehydrogenase complex dihydrolipoamide dehydrogenase (E3) component
MVTLVIVHDFDLLVIGSGPGGQKAAIAAAKA